MKCLRKISGVSIWNKDQWHVNNAAVRQFLGIPTVVQLISQARLRWLGHVVRMDPARLPKQILFRFLPGNIGAPTAPWRRPGKWWSFDIVNDLELAKVDKHAWMHVARKEEGEAWRRITYEVAPWFAPVQPTQGRNAPQQNANDGLKVIARNKKLSFPEVTKVCKRELDEREEVSRFLDAERKLGGFDNLSRCLIEWFKENVGDEWLEWDSQELVGELAGTTLWDEYFVAAADVGLFLLVVQTIQHIENSKMAVSREEKKERMLGRSSGNLADALGISSQCRRIVFV